MFGVFWGGVEKNKGGDFGDGFRVGGGMQFTWRLLVFINFFNNGHPWPFSRH